MIKGIVIISIIGVIGIIVVIIIIIIISVTLSPPPPPKKKIQSAFGYRLWKEWYWPPVEKSWLRQWSY